MYNFSLVIEHELGFRLKVMEYHYHLPQTITDHHMIDSSDMIVMNYHERNTQQTVLSYCLPKQFIHWINSLKTFYPIKRIIVHLKNCTTEAEMHQ